MIQRPSRYNKGSQVQRKTGHVYIKDVDGKWRPRGRVLIASLMGRPLEPWEKVFHKNGIPNEDNMHNCVLIKFTGTKYFIERSKPIYISKKDEVFQGRKTK